MSRKDTEDQRKSMSRLFRGTQIFKPLNTGRIDEHVACVREWVANIFFYTKNGTTIMIDAGYNYPRLKEKMGWLDIDPASIRHILITHQDTDHVGALEPDSERLFKDGTATTGYAVAWSRSCVALGIGQEVSTSVDRRPDKNNAWQVFADMSIGAARLEDEGVVEIACA
jgi:hypothetical protein